MYVLDLENNVRVEVEVVTGRPSLMPLKKDGWNFNWKSTIKRKNTKTYVLRQKWKPEQVEGVLQLRESEGMLIMDLVEIAPHNIGIKTKRYDRVAGILIAYACRESFMLDNEYKGFLTFLSKTELVEHYKSRYGARQALGQRMYIEPEEGMRLISEFLEN